MGIRVQQGESQSETPLPGVQSELVDALESKGIRATPQAISSLCKSIEFSPAEIVGDTDSLLLGLLCSGSYTVDVLESAMADPRLLKEMAWDSVLSTANLADEDPIDKLISSRLMREAANRGVLETADILTTAISPTDREWAIGAWHFPFELVEHGPGAKSLKDELTHAVSELLVNLVGELYTDFEGNQIKKMLANRRHPITDDEDQRLDDALGTRHDGVTVEELDFGIAALNHWFLHRRLLTQPADVCLRLVDRFEALLYGPSQFAEAGGDLDTVAGCLEMAAKFNPERDLAGLALFNRDGRIAIGQYTYRNTFVTDTRVQTGYPFRRVALQALRPVSLISTQLVHALEELISRQDVREPAIQEFLRLHPGFLEALGYTNVLPHVCLREEGKSKLIPDFLLELPGGRGFDILDLKLPSARLVAKQPYPRISRNIVAAIAQLRKYDKFFDHANTRRAFLRKYGLEAFKPELIVVIGRSRHFSSRDERVEIEEQMGRIRLLTYDDLVDYGRSRSIYVPKSCVTQ